MYVQEWFEISYLMMWSSPLPIKFNFTLGLQIQLFDIQYTKKKKKKKRKKDATIWQSCQFIMHCFNLFSKQ